MMADFSMRPSVLWFGLRMEQRLLANDHKGGWVDCDERQLLLRLVEELGEMAKAIDLNRVDDIPKECADVANFAMMIATNRCVPQLSEPRLTESTGDDEVAA